MGIAGWAKDKSCKTEFMRYCPEGPLENDIHDKAYLKSQCCGKLQGEMDKEEEEVVIADVVVPEPDPDEEEYDEDEDDEDEEDEDDEEDEVGEDVHDGAEL